jgi:hypothetical protein
MFAKIGVAISIAICLGAAGAALASERDSSGGYQARQGIQEPSHVSFDVGRAYALDESSKAKKKAPKHVKTEPASTSGSAARAESSDEAARLRRYQENH